MYSSLTGSDFPYQRKLIFIATPILEIHPSENHWNIAAVAFAIQTRRRYDPVTKLRRNTKLFLPAKVLDFKLDDVAGLEKLWRFHAEADTGRRAR